MITCELWEDYGSYPGEHRAQVTNCNLMTTSNPADNYWQHAVTRPQADSASPLTLSYSRNFFFKIISTESNFKDVKLMMKTPSGATWKVFGAFTTAYKAPQISLDGSLTNLDVVGTWYPRLSTLGPEDASRQYTTIHSPGTFYTEYLRLQFHAFKSSYDDVDNFGLETLTLSWKEIY